MAKVERILREEWAQGLDPAALASAEGSVDLDASEATCPACGASFPTHEPRCPDCGLRFG